MSDNRPMRLIVAGLVAASVAACGNLRVPAPDSAQSGGGAEAARCVADTGQTGEFRVCGGDTLIALAHRYNVTVRGLMRANSLPDDRIYVGQVLTLPREFVHVVAPGEHLLAIARQYRVSDSAVVAANEMRPPYTIFPEQRLAIPSDRSGSVPRAAPRPIVREVPPDAVAALPPAESGPGPAPVAVAVVTSDRQTGAGVEGAVVEEAGAGEPARSTTAGAATPRPAVPRQRPPEPGASAPASGANARGQAPAGTDRAAVAEPTKPAPAARAQDAGFLIPVQGRIISDYGPKSGGLHNDGINIAAPRGTPIVATADGEIAYAGDGLPGFGNLVLIRHAGGWTSAYAHADSVNVKRGDKVSRGDRIGSVGSTGGVTEPQLHFELRKHDRAVDPKPRLSS